MATLHATRLRALRRRRLMSRRAVARKIHTTRATIGRYERSEAWCPAVHRNALADLFGVSVPYLMGWKEVD